MTDLNIFSACAAISTLIDGCLLTWLLLRCLRRETAEGGAISQAGLRRLALALTIVGCVFVFKLAIFTFLGVRLFGWMRLIYFDLVIMIPAVCAIVLFVGLRSAATRRRFTSGVLCLAVLGILGAPIGVYATFIEPYRLQLETATIQVDSMARVASPIRVGVLADIQTDFVTDYERGAVDRLMAEQPDIVLLPGDLLQCTRRQYAAQIDAMRELVNRMDAPGGAFFVEGDVDGLDRLRPLFWDTPVRMLVNEIAETKVGDRRVLIAGVELNFVSADAKETIQQLIDMPRNDRIKILMAHRPDVVMQLPHDADIDLVVAGHTHGGQVVIPGFGPPMTLSQLPRHIGAGGLHDWNGNGLYVSRGVGLERGMSPRLRFLCPPEISLLTLTGPE